MKKILLSIVLLSITFLSFGQSVTTVVKADTIKAKICVKQNIKTLAASKTLAKSDSLVLCSGNITVTLPTVTALDKGIEITIKNQGTYTDLITVIGNTGYTIDGINASSTLTRWRGRTYVCTGADAWEIKEKETRADNLLDVSAKGSWTTIAEVVAYLDLHCTSPTVVRIGGGSYPIASTIQCNWSYPVTFEGLSFDESTLTAATGLLGKPMFRCTTEVHFKMLKFDATTLSTYGTHVAENGIVLKGSATYHEIKDCLFKSFYIGVYDSTNVDTWFFETEFDNAVYAGIQFKSAVAGGTVKTAICKFVSCARGIILLGGTTVNFDIQTSQFTNGIASDSAFILRGAFCTLAAKDYFDNNVWNGTGVFVSGMDMSLAAGTYANVFMQGNAGMEDKSPHCKVNLVGASASKSFTINQWNKVTFTATSNYTCKFTIATDSITYQPTNVRDLMMWISGAIQTTSQPATIQIAVLKNHDRANPYGVISVYLDQNTRAFNFSTNVYISDAAAGDVFSIYLKPVATEDIIIVDLDWLVRAQ